MCVCVASECVHVHKCVFVRMCAFQLISVSPGKHTNQHVLNNAWTSRHIYVMYVRRTVNTKGGMHQREECKDVLFYFVNSSSVTEHGLASHLPTQDIHIFLLIPKYSNP